MDQETVRNNLENHIKKYGTSVTHIAKNCGLARETISRLRHNKVQYSTNMLNKVQAYLSKFN